MLKAATKSIIKATKLPQLYKYLSYVTDFKKFKALAARKKERFLTSWKDRFPCLHDKTDQTYFDRHYIYHTAWAARVLAKTQPQNHVDISSSLYFSSIASAFVPIKFYDYRPAKLNLSNLTSEHADLLRLPFDNKSIDSLSCMHVVEHIGLGRYGDPLDPDGDLKAMKELERVLAINGNLLFVVPVGKPKIMFNAHRIYSYEEVVKNFPRLTLQEFVLITDDTDKRDIMHNPKPDIVAQQTYGCGCFWFKRA
ncbi:DUF268 domain-containing protein [Candidatus Babeliales bacterium]|nr:DUF268 domain-containing protein [Candidatus Babeliales bacterium]